MNKTRESSLLLAIWRAGAAHCTGPGFAYTGMALFCLQPSSQARLSLTLTPHLAERSNAPPKEVDRTTPVCVAFFALPPLEPRARPRPWPPSIDGGGEDWIHAVVLPGGFQTILDSNALALSSHFFPSEVRHHHTDRPHDTYHKQQGKDVAADDGAGGDDGAQAGGGGDRGELFSSV